MLAHIRSALGHAGSASTPRPLRSFPDEAAPSQSEDIVSRFSSELERVGGVVKRLPGAANLADYVETLLPDHPDAVVAVSDSSVILQSGIRAWLAERNVRSIKTLREFATEFASANAVRADTEAAALMEQYKHTLLRACLGITSADYAIADTGTLVLVSGGEQHRLMSLLPPIHICLLETSRIVPNLAVLLARVKDDFYAGDAQPPQAMTFITGPSRTADIEHVLTMGVHGPSELHVVLYSCSS